MKKSELIIASVGLVLVLAVILGVCVFIFNYDSFLDEVTDSLGSGSDSSGSGSDSSGDSNKDTSGTVVKPTYSDFYVDGDLGYITQDGVTTFFLILSAPEYVNSSTCERYWCFSYEKNYIVHTVTTDVSTELCHKYSLNGDFVWKDLTSNGSYHGLNVDTVGGMVSNLPGQTDKVYLALYQVENIENPMTEIEFMRENAFRNDYRISGACYWCGGVYVGYSGFVIDIDHRLKPDDNGAIG